MKKLICLGSVSIDLSAISEEQRKKLQVAAERLSTLQIRSCPVPSDGYKWVNGVVRKKRQ